ncbi:glycosyltransferase [Flavitalea sp. BT771]|uniref:glycosyltransferase n=1 Tax=Flavitalea sp. BT771 TaxID=3063329 RepID=UPI0026E31290|nr:glycosyltransferase [Flavitalea sp. BT771]MDO6431645.1 glycosyltransferase [Flavitalea sp. BT771]MDV6220553.1 glycosyltransferase [Flavitalea sp. BT771]
MSNKIIQSLWIGNRLSNNELLCLWSYIRHGHEFHLYAYEEIAGLPVEVRLLDANTILPATSLFKDTGNTYASFADWFRLKLLFQKGGWWVDMDTICMKPFDIDGEFCFSSEWKYGKEECEVNNTCIKSPANAAWLGELLDGIERKVGSGTPVKWGEIGVYLFRKEMSRYDELLPHIREPAAFCPLDYFDLSSLICKSLYTPSRETLAVHLWNEIWRRGNLDKNATYHPESLYERLKKIYLP